MTASTQLIRSEVTTRMQKMRVRAKFHAHLIGLEHRLWRQFHAAARFKVRERLI
jgi:hypothetical protein